MPIVIKIGNRSIRIWSVWAEEIRNLLIKSKTRKVYILLYALAWPFYIMAWFGKLVCFIVCLSIAISGLYTFLVPLFSSKPHIEYSVLLFFLIGLVLLFLCVRYVWRLRLLFKSEQIPIEELLPMIGLILFCLMAAIIYLSF